MDHGLLTNQLNYHRGNQNWIPIQSSLHSTKSHLNPTELMFFSQSLGTNARILSYLAWSTYWNSLNSDAERERESEIYGVHDCHKYRYFLCACVLYDATSIINIYNIMISVKANLLDIWHMCTHICISHKANSHIRRVLSNM